MHPSPNTTSLQSRLPLRKSYWHCYYLSKSRRQTEFPNVFLTIFYCFRETSKHTLEDRVYCNALCILRLRPFVVATFVCWSLFVLTDPILVAFWSIEHYTQRAREEVTNEKTEATLARQDGLRDVVVAKPSHEDEAVIAVTTDVSTG